MNLRRSLLLLSLLVVSVAPRSAQAYDRPWIYELTPASGCTYSVAFGMSPDGNTVVGVSSSSTIIVGTDEQITPSAGQTFVATVWNTSSLPTGGPFVISGTALSALSSSSASLYSVSNSGATYVGTKFSSSGTQGFFSSGSTVTNFLASTSNSYGIGLGGVGGVNIATGWAANGTNNSPCFYVINAPTGTSTGLNYFTSSSGIAYNVSVPPELTLSPLYEAGVAGTAGGAPAAWSIYYTKPTKSSPYSGPYVGTYTGFPTTGTTFAVLPNFDTFDTSGGTSLGGTDTSASPVKGFLWTGTTGSYSGSSSDVAESSIYGMYSSTMYVGVTSGAAYVSTEYATYGTLYNWLSNYNFGPISAPPVSQHIYTAFGISNWSELDAAYQVTLNSSPGFYYAIGYGNVTGTGQTGYLAVYETE